VYFSYRTERRELPTSSQLRQVYFSYRTEGRELPTSSQLKQTGAFVCASSYSMLNVVKGSARQRAVCTVQILNFLR
jgi:hypothetical protein